MSISRKNSRKTAFLLTKGFLLAFILTSVVLTTACGDPADSDNTDQDDERDLEGSGGGEPSGSGGEGSGDPASGGTGSGGDGSAGDGSGGDGAGGDGAGGDGSGGDGSGGDGTGGTVDPVTECTSLIEASESAFTELCAIDGPVRHVRIEGLLAPRTHASTQVLFGFSEAPASTNPVTGEGQFKAMFYGGGVPFPTPQLVGQFGELEATLSDNATFVHTSSTVCFDLHHGSESTPPHLVVWVDGVNGADCEDFDSLSLETAFSRELWWEGATGAITAGLPTYFRQAAEQAATVTLFADAATDPSLYAPFECTSTIASDNSTISELCQTEGPARHIKIEGLYATGHSFARLAFGFEQAPASSQPEVGDGQAHILFYGGTPQVTKNFEGMTSTTVGADFLHSTSTVCMDVHDGSDESAPYMIIWVDGQEGADCDDKSTLNLASAFSVELTFEGQTGAINRAAPVFFQKNAGQEAIVSVSSVTALSAEEALLGQSCTTTWISNTAYQPLCTPAVGKIRHIRMSDVASTLNSNYFYLVLGYPEEAPTTNPSVGVDSSTFVLTGGRTHDGFSRTYFRFNTNTYPGTADYGLYTPEASTICLDLDEVRQGEDAGNLQIRLWATGKNDADCEDLSTLTLDNVLYASVTSDVEYWNAALADGGYNFIKVSNTGASIGEVFVSSELAVH